MTIVVIALLAACAALAVSLWQTHRHLNAIRRNADERPPIWHANMAKKSMPMDGPEQTIREWVRVNQPLFDWVRGGFTPSTPKPEPMTSLNLLALAAEMGVDLDKLLENLRHAVGDLGTMQLCLRDNGSQPPDMFLSATERR